MAFSKEASLEIGRGLAAFFLNLIAATLGVASGSGVRLSIAALLFSFTVGGGTHLDCQRGAGHARCLGVSLCWSTTTAKWVWVFPAACLLFRMVAFGLNPGGSIMAGHPSVWKHFFHPEFSVHSAIMDYVDFEVFTLAPYEQQHIPLLPGQPQDG